MVPAACEVQADCEAPADCKKKKGVVPGKGHALFATSHLRLRRLLTAKLKLLLCLSQL